jgi:hypothetical protein
LSRKSLSALLVALFTDIYGYLRIFTDRGSGQLLKIQEIEGLTPAFFTHIRYLTSITKESFQGIEKQYKSSPVCGRTRIDGVSAMLFHAQWKEMYPE